MRWTSRRLDRRRHKCRLKSSITTIKRYLVETGVLPALVAPAEDPSIARFALWLQQNRGIGARTIGK